MNTSQMKYITTYALACLVGAVSAVLFFAVTLVITIGFAIFTGLAYITRFLQEPVEWVGLPMLVRATLFGFKRAFRWVMGDDTPLLRTPPPSPVIHIQSSSTRLFLAKFFQQKNIARPLKEEEINTFKEILSEKKIQHWEKLTDELANYQNYMQDRCALSLEPIPFLENPVTIEGTTGYKRWAKTYEAEYLYNWIETKGEEAATEPMMQCLLSKTTGCKGYPNSICEFINKVNLLLSQHKKIEEKPVRAPTLLTSAQPPLSLKKL